MRRHMRAFTLVELLVVIAIIGVLVSLMLPAVQMAREAARRSSCFNNLKQIGLALHQYADANGRFPMGWVGVDATAPRRPHAEGVPGWGWAAKILPYLEQGNLAESVIRDTLPITNPVNDRARAFRLPIYRCPSDVSDSTFELWNGTSGVMLTRLPVANYVGVFSNVRPLQTCQGLPVGQQCLGNGIFYHLSNTGFADVGDGLSNTFMVGERSSRIDHSTWMGVVPGGTDAFARILGVADHPPNTTGAHLDDFGSQHPSGANFALGDGSVRLISQTINMDVYRAMATRAGREPLSLE